MSRNADVSNNDAKPLLNKAFMDLIAGYSLPGIADIVDPQRREPHAVSYPTRADHLQWFWYHMLSYAFEQAPAMQQLHYVLMIDDTDGRDNNK